jgi:gamma-glutamylcyclotransferase (GGCT)/AIG2-like uncharacterized protein YtfP
MSWVSPPDQVAGEHPEKVPLFVYGTLRVGGESHSRLKTLLAGDAVRARVQGTLSVCSEGPWPLLIPGTEAVVGDVLPVRACRELWDVLGGWEVGWGYSLRWLPTLDNPESRVLACVWEWPHLVGATVPTGDWLDFCQAN